MIDKIKIKTYFLTITYFYFFDVENFLKKKRLKIILNFLNKLTVFRHFQKKFRMTAKSVLIRLSYMITTLQI